ncbi:MAG: hypothetical protein RBT49_15500 [Bacteroidales bacterium]|jgi:hypothetical protein|nr:hypothetical protein [Bacteroidales bacterium]
MMRVLKTITLIVVIPLLISTNNKTNAQSSFSVGFGIPEYVNLGYKWHKDQSGYSIAIGTLPANSDFLISSRAGYLYHFFGTRKHSEIKPWYINPGLAYNAIKSDNNLDQYIMADLRLGREFSLSPNWGAFAELGVLYILWDQVADYSFDFTFSYQQSFLPSINLGVYYRLKKGCNCPKIKMKP